MPVVYVGLHLINKLKWVEHSMLSVNLLHRRRKPFSANKWILDSGAFTRITGGKQHLPVAEYAGIIQKWCDVGEFQCAVAQDYMCEPIALNATGLSVREHQRLTTQRYVDLINRLQSDNLVMPVIQGYFAEDYVRHLRDLSDLLPRGKWVGVGSVCKRQGNPRYLYRILDSLLDVRSDLRFHGFGVKRSSLLYPEIQRLFYSVDSMAWSFNARVAGRDANDINEAIVWHRELTHDMVHNPRVVSAVAELPGEFCFDGA